MTLNNKIVVFCLHLFITINTYNIARATEESSPAQQKELLLQQLQRLEKNPDADKTLIQEIQKTLKKIEQEEQQHLVPENVASTQCETQEVKEQQESLTLLEKEVLNFGKNFSNEESIDLQDKLTLEAIQLFIKTEIDLIKLSIQTQHPGTTPHLINQQLDILLRFCFIQKNIAAKLELLLIGSNITPRSMVSPALSYSQIYHIYVQILNELYLQLSTQWRETCTKKSIDHLRKTLFPNEQITKLIIKNLPPFLRYTFGSKYVTKSGRNLLHLYELLSYNTNEDLHFLYTRYEEIMLPYRSHLSLADLPNFFKKIAIVIAEFSKQLQEIKEFQPKGKQEEFASRCVTEIIELFIAKLLFIQQEQSQLETWNKNYTQTPKKVSFWLKHQEIILDPSIAQLCKNNPLFNTCFLQYIKIMTMFFNDQDQLPEFTYSLLLTLTNLKLVSTPQNSFTIFFFTFIKKYMPGFMTRFLKTTLDSSVPSKMETQLNNVMDYLLTTVETKSSTHVILSELSKEKTKNGPTDEFLLGTTQQFVNNNISSIKKGLLYLFSNVSPYIAIALIMWVFPKLSEEIKSKFTQFFEHHQGNPTDQKNPSVSTFIAHNPDVLEALCKLYPALMQELSKQQKGATTTAVAG